MTDRELLDAAIAARENAYAPYSRFSVGAALLTREGRVYPGCNIESVSFTPTCCAERTAVYAAVSRGERDFVALAVAGGPTGEMPRGLCTPCGVCRQVLTEFCTSDLRVILGDGDTMQVTTLGELFPLPFTPKNLL